MEKEIRVQCVNFYGPGKSGQPEKKDTNLITFSIWISWHFVFFTFGKEEDVSSIFMAKKLTS